MKNREEFELLLYNLLNEDISTKVIMSMVDSGIISNNIGQSFISRPKDFSTYSEEDLLLVYYNLANGVKGAKDIKNYFEQIEIDNALSRRTKRRMDTLTFEAVKIEPLDQYALILSAKEINELQLSGRIEIDSTMQRESKTVEYNNQLITHVVYNDHKAREIGETLANRNYWSDAIRWNLMDDDTAKYHYEDGMLIVESGRIVLLDGMHRSRGIEYALLKDPYLEYYFPVILTIADREKAQSIIAQHEKLSPIKKSVVKSYQNTPANSILKEIKNNSTIKKLYKFTNDFNNIKNKTAFVFESSVVDAIEKYYDISTIRQQNETAAWLIEFLIETLYFFEDDYRNYVHVQNYKWSVHHYIFPAIIWLSKELQNEANWKDILEKVYSSIDFSIDKKPWSDGSLNPTTFIINDFTGRLNYV